MRVGVEFLRQHECCGNLSQNFIVVSIINIYSKKKVIYQAVFFRDAPQLAWSFSPVQPCARYSHAFNSSTRIVYLTVFKQILFHYISRFGFYLQGKIKVVSYFFL